MDQETSTTDAFETVLQRGRTTLADARTAYSTLELTDSVPQSLIEAIGDLEHELDELDQTLEVTTEDLHLAEQTTRRATILADVFEILEERQRRIVEHELSRLETVTAALTDLRDDTDLPADCLSQLDRVEREVSMLRKLADGGRYGQVVSANRVSPGKIDCTLRNIAATLTEDCAPDAVTALYLESSSELLEASRELLNDVSEINGDRLAIDDQIGAVQAKLTEAETTRDAGQADKATRHARIGLEGAFMIHEQTGRIHGNQTVSQALASILEAEDVSIDDSIDKHVSQGENAALLAAIDQLVRSQVERSTGERLFHLLKEHDGSVVRTAEATDFEISTILNELEQLYRHHPIADIEVVINR